MYATAEEILGLIQLIRTDFTIDSIDTSIQSMAAAEVNGELVKWGVFTFPTTDISDTLKSAEICYYMELAGMLRQIQNVFGVLKQEKIGNWTQTFENGMPMFFFASGSSAPFFQLLPHESWRMRGYSMIDRFGQLKFATDNAAIGCHSAYAHDPEWE